jgi:hypothetical protein
MARFIVDGATLFFALGVTQAGLCKAPYLCDFSNNEDTLLVVSESSPSSVSVLKADPIVTDPTVRQPVVFGTTSLADSKACISVLPNDDLCVMGAAVTTSASWSGPASAAGYFKAGRWLYPPKVVNGSATMTLEEGGLAPRRYIFDNPTSQPQMPDHVAGGFVIAAAGTVLDTNATNRKALFFVDTTVSPWVVKTTLSR